MQPIVFHHVMDRVDAAGWQIIQQTDGLEVLLAVPHSVDFHQVEMDLRTALTATGAVSPQVHIREVDAIPRTALGKAPLIRKGSTLDGKPERST